MRKTLYMAVEDDEYALPIYCATSLNELARVLGVEYKHLYYHVRGGKSLNKRIRYCNRWVRLEIINIYDWEEES